MLVAPMREDLTRVGFKELKTAQEVDDTLGKEERTTMVAINSVCGCAAGAMRPAVALSLQNSTKPEVLLTVFAGQDLEATEKAREYFSAILGLKVVTSLVTITLVFSIFQLADLPEGILTLLGIISISIFYND